MLHIASYVRSKKWSGNGRTVGDGLAILRPIANTWWILTRTMYFYKIVVSGHFVKYLVAAHKSKSC